MDSFAKYSGVIAVMLFWVSFGINAARENLGGLTSVSEFGILEKTETVFNMSLFASALIAIFFFTYYLGRRYKLNRHYWLSCVAVFISQTLMTFFPIDPTRPLYYTAHHNLSLIFFLAAGGLMYNFAVSLNDKVPGSIKSRVVDFLVFGCFGASVVTNALFGTILIAELVFIIYTHYWIIRTTFLSR